MSRMLQDRAADPLPRGCNLIGWLLGFFPQILMHQDRFFKVAAKQYSRSFTEQISH